MSKYRNSYILIGLGWLMLVGMSKVPVTLEPQLAEEPAIGHCNDFSLHKNPYFGDLHVHTGYSMDAAQAGVITTPDDAYRFAKGEEIMLPPHDEDGHSDRTLQLDRPLDFTAVTDHSEFLAETSICFNRNNLAYYGPYCVTMRGTEDGNHPLDTLAFALGMGGIVLPGGEFNFGFCKLRPELCEKRASDSWKSTQNAAQKAYDRSSNCSFTSFIGYEWTGSPAMNNQHRNIIYRNEIVSEAPISYFDADKPHELWEMLDDSCTHQNNGCEILTIPHNSNLGGGTMFQPYTEKENPYTPEIAAQRQRLEPLIEIYQHKGASECVNSPNVLLASEDELCEFELIVSDICTGSEADAEDCTPLCSDLPVPIGAFSGRCAEPSDFARGILRNGLKEQSRIGVNPFKIGFIGSTDTHNGTPGAVEERGFKGHTGKTDADLESLIGTNSTATTSENDLASKLKSIIETDSIKRYSAGGLAVIWAEQNSRGALFDSMQNRETYATSGPRIITRFFGGWHLPDDMCSQENFAKKGYALGVPMGGDLPSAPLSESKPKFAISAFMDVGSDNFPGTELQQIQVIKGWEKNGETYEKVLTVAGDANNGASVNLDTCQVQGSGYTNLCAVWTDETFSQSQNAFYYARVVENPTCRWHKHQCNAAFEAQKLSCDTITAEHPLSACCDGSTPDTVQERAWTSPIWYQAR